MIAVMGHTSLSHRIYKPLAQILRMFVPTIWTKTPSLFVLSTGRTGTAALARILSLSPSIDAFHEPAPQPLRERQAAFWEIEKNIDKYAIKFQELRSRQLTEALLRRRIYVETSPRFTFFAPAIAKVHPKAKFLYLHRHPGEVVRSGMRRDWYGGHPADEYRIRPHPESDEGLRWQNWSQFEKICWYWKAYNRFSLRFISQIANDRVLIVPYEAFVRKDVELFLRIFEFIDAIPPGKDDIYRVLDVPVNEQKKGNYPPYSEWPEMDKIRLKEICEPEMSILGYTE